MTKLTLTIVEIINTKDFNVIIPSTFLDEIAKEGWTNLLLLLNPVTKKITLIPTHSHKVHKITFYLNNKKEFINAKYFKMKNNIDYYNKYKRDKYILIFF